MMEMSVQELLFTVSMCAFAAGAVMGVASVYYFVSRDIRGVRDDLLGRTRQRAVEDAHVQQFVQVAPERMRSAWEEFCTDEASISFDSFGLNDALSRDDGFDLDAAFGFDGLCGFDGEAQLAGADGEA
ncbi:MAG: hypothetical protein Q4B54_14215 [Coriobacteriales bacterium]|nr:hypothetical protein [Coriobacteriales bacterium]